jgi:glucosamine 6-phosphate synthetase-like amidotransferase/phosphosugar isomerase protein
MFQSSNILSPFTTDIIKSGDTYVITYKKDEYVGSVIYTEHNMVGTNKPIRKKIYMITSSDMGDVIEYINKISPLKDGDITNINKIIRDDSLGRLNEYLRQD